MIMNKIFFTADLHFGHTNILKHQPDRPFAQEGDYILGDLTFFKSEDARHLLEKLPGQKFLIQGNHDGSIRAYSNYFKTTAQILDLTIKPTACPFLTENLQLTLCHWNSFMRPQWRRQGVSLSTSTQNRTIARK